MDIETKKAPAMSEVNAKRCTKCGVQKSLEEFSRRERSVDGLQSQCKSCVADYTQRHYENNREKILGRKQIYRKENPDKAHQQDHDYHQKNRNAILARMRAYHAENRNRILAQKQIYRAENLDKARKQQRDWRRANPEKLKARYHRYQARKRSLPHVFTDENWRAALDAFGGRCAACERPPGLWHTLAADHWIPLTSPECPGTVPQNIVPLCHGESGCNNSKGNRNALEWAISRFGPRKGRAIVQRIMAQLLLLPAGSPPPGNEVSE